MSLRKGELRYNTVLRSFHHSRIVSGQTPPKNKPASLHLKPEEGRSDEGGQTRCQSIKHKETDKILT